MRKNQLIIIRFAAVVFALCINSIGFAQWSIRDPRCGQGPEPGAPATSGEAWCWPTPENNLFGVWYNMWPNYSRQEADTIAYELQQLYPRAVFLYDANILYNCHAYVLGFGNARVNDVGIMVFRAEGSLQYTGQLGVGIPDMATIIDLDARLTTDRMVIIHWRYNHTGEYLGGGYVKSKWGKYGVYRHEIGYGPYLPYWYVFIAGPSVGTPPW